MNEKPKDWRRPGARINVYFSDLSKLRKLDQQARKNGRTRAAQIMHLIESANRLAA